MSKPCIWSWAPSNWPCEHWFSWPCWGTPKTAGIEYEHKRLIWGIKKCIIRWWVICYPISGIYQSQRRDWTGDGIEWRKIFRYSSGVQYRWSDGWPLIVLPFLQLSINQSRWTSSRQLSGFKLLVNPAGKVTGRLALLLLRSSSSFKACLSSWCRCQMMVNPTTNTAIETMVSLSGEVNTCAFLRAWRVSVCDRSCYHKAHLMSIHRRGEHALLPIWTIPALQTAI